MRKFVLGISAAMAFTGCYKASIHLRPAEPVVASRVVDDEMHVNVVGIFELTKDVDLETACSGGTVIIEERVGIVAGIINSFLGTYVPIVHVMNATAMCGLPAGTATTEPGSPAPR